MKYEPSVLDWNNAGLVSGKFDEARLGNIEMFSWWVAPPSIFSRLIVVRRAVVGCGDKERRSP